MICLDSECSPTSDTVNIPNSYQYTMSVASCNYWGKRHSPHYTLILEEGTKWQGLELCWMSIQVRRNGEGWVKASIHLYSSSAPDLSPPVFKFEETHSELLQDLIQLFRGGLSLNSVERFHLDVLIKRLQIVHSQSVRFQTEGVSATPACWMIDHRPVAVVAPIVRRNNEPSTSRTFY